MEAYNGAIALHRKLQRLGDIMGNRSWMLEARDDKGKCWTTKLDHFPFLVGRSKQCHLTLSKSDVSREHSRIFIRKDEIFIEDCNSTNGTLLNGVVVTEAKRFYEHDKLNICGFEFKLVIDEEDCDDKTLISAAVSPSERFSNKYKLTPRESELLSYLTKGFSTKDIASSMFISPGTAKNHILNLLKKTGTHSRLELIRAYDDLMY